MFRVPGTRRGIATAFSSAVAGGLMAMLPSVASAQSQVCYALSDDAQRLVGVQQSGAAWNVIYNQTISGLTPESTEALFYDGMTGRFFTVDQGSPQSNPDRLGFISLSNTVFTPIGTNLGSVSSGATTVVIGGGTTNQTSGISRDSATGQVYGLTINGFLYKIDVATGQAIPNAFGPGVGYVRVRSGATNYIALDDLTFDPAGNLYITRNRSSAPFQSVLLRVDKTTGLILEERPITINGSAEAEFEGLSTGLGGTLYATTGYGVTNPANRNRLWTLDPATGAATLQVALPISGATDYESLACLNATNSNADLFISKTNTPASGPGDLPADTVISGSATAYVVSVSNDGPMPAHGAVARDVLGAGLSGCSVTTCNAVNGATCPVTPVNLMSPAGVPIPVLPMGGRVDFTVTCNVD